MAQKAEQIEVEIDVNGERSPRNTGGSESFRRRSKDQLPEDARNSGGPQVLRCSSNSSFSRNSWKPPMSKTRSRLMDPPDERRPKSDRVAHSGRVDEDDAFDVDDIPEEYKRIKFNTLTLAQWESLFNQYVIETLSGPPLFQRQHIQEQEEKAAAEIREFQKAGACMPRELRATLLPRNGRVFGSGGLQSSPQSGGVLDFLLSKRRPSLGSKMKRSQLTTCIS
ncbi:hypothetical protein M0R45_012310 [Rubus argutus]|uniref:Uncharacterized protein n=1 Tax=Rubus argutus TaxID=59490 RepID=A0AAW1YDK3_RUBAR